MTVGTAIDPGLAVSVAARAKVLIVDDDERNLLALAEVLDDIADVVQASSGEEALRWLLRDRFAVIVLDVLMPGIDGYETAELIRSREQSRDTPIILLTAINKEDRHLLRGYDSGAVDFVFKPFDPNIVRSKVSVFVSLHEKTLEIERTGAAQQRLLKEKLEAQAHSLAALNALRQSEQRQDLILSSLPIAVYVEGPKGSERRFVSGDVKKITGYEPADFATDPTLWSSRMQPDEKSPSELLHGEGRTLEYQWLHADGAYRTFLDQAVVLEGAEDNALAGTIRDITEQRTMQDQLLQAQKMDAIGKLTGGVAHDFNNLLASVLSGLALIEKRSNLDSKVLEILHMTRHAAEQGRHLVNRLLTFSRRQNLTPRVVELAPICRSLDAMLAPTLGGLVSLNWELPPELWESFVDASQLELALMNLVINSRDAMRDGGVITVHLANRTYEGSKDLPPGQFVVLTVSDTGAGISPNVLPKVLEPFFTTKDIGSGTGLGLSMAYGFARQSGGTLQIRSTEGIGTEVELWLPRAHMQNETPAPSTEESASVQACSSSARVLLVDDSQTLRRLTAIQLTEAGFVVETASSGTEALTLIGQDPDAFDILLTDYAMPTMSGLELVTAAREQRPDFPAVIITGYADIEAMNNRPSDVAVVPKPFTTAKLITALESSLSEGERKARSGSA